MTIRIDYNPHCKDSCDIRDFLHKTIKYYKIKGDCLITGTKIPELYYSFMEETANKDKFYADFVDIDRNVCKILKEKTNNSVHRRINIHHGTISDYKLVFNLPREATVIDATIALSLDKSSFIHEGLFRNQEMAFRHRKKFQAYIGNFQIRGKGPIHGYSGNYSSIIEFINDCLLRRLNEELDKNEQKKICKQLYEKKTIKILGKKGRLKVCYILSKTKSPICTFLIIYKSGGF